jgi:hypothetical protein
LSSFWLTLKQQWTIKISSPLFLFLAWRPSWLEVGITGHNFERGPSKDHSTKVWLQLVQWFLRRRLKCEMLTDGRRTKSDDNSSHGLKARWAKNWFIQDFGLFQGAVQTGFTIYGLQRNNNIMPTQQMF